MTRKDYILLASALREVIKNDIWNYTGEKLIGYNQAIMDIIILLGAKLEKENELFDFNKFLEACNK